MPKPYSSASVSLDVKAGQAETLTEFESRMAAPGRDSPFHILVLGDFSGRSPQLREAGAGARKPIEIDRDNFDDVLRRLRASVELRFRNIPPVTLQFGALEDFEPDTVVQRVDQFRTLEQRARSSPPAPAPEAAPAPRFTPDLGALTSGSLLDDILAQSEAGISGTARRRDEFQSVVERIVAPHTEPRATPDELRAAAQSTDRRGTFLRAILHHPDFQSIEAAWRSLDLLVRRLETDEFLKIFVFDISKDEAARDLLADGDLRSSQLYRALVEETVETPGGEPWSVVVGNYAFDESPADTALLEKLALLARFAGAPLLAQADLTGDPPSEEWQVLRRSTNAKYLGLALPRMLLRMPYGKETVAIESFEFEELQGAPDHAHYLWGNPAFFCAVLLGQSFTKYGWDFRPGAIQQMDGLPLHTYKANGETQTQPCGEILLTEHQAEMLLDQGFMPVASLKGRDAVRLVRFQSIAEPLAALAGRWN